MMSKWAARWGLIYRQPVSLLSVRVVYRLDHPQVPRKRLRHKQPCDAYGAGRWTHKWQVDVSVVLLENMAFLAFHVPTIHDLMIAICLHHQKLLFCKKCKTHISAQRQLFREWRVWSKQKTHLVWSWQWTVCYPTTTTTKTECSARTTTRGCGEAKPKLQNTHRPPKARPCHIYIPLPIGLMRLIVCILTYIWLNLILTA